MYSNVLHCTVLHLNGMLYYVTYGLWKCSHVRATNQTGINWLLFCQDRVRSWRAAAIAIAVAVEEEAVEDDRMIR